MERRDFLLAGSTLVALKPIASMAAEAAGRVQQFTTPYGKFIVKNLTLSPTGHTMQGVVTNSTDRAWRWVSFLLRMRDASNNLIPHDDGFDGHFYVKDLGKGRASRS